MPPPGPSACRASKHSAPFPIVIAESPIRIQSSSSSDPSPVPLTGSVRVGTIIIIIEAEPLCSEQDSIALPVVDEDNTITQLNAGQKKMVKFCALVCSRV